MFAVFENWIDAPLGLKSEAPMVGPRFALDVMLIDRQGRKGVGAHQ